MEIKPLSLEGKQALLAPMTREHIPVLHAAAQHPEIWSYMTYCFVPDLPAMEGIVDAALRGQALGQQLPFVIINKENELVVGSTRLLDINLAHRNVEIGWTWLTPGVWRSSINTECKYLLLGYCFETLGMVRVLFKTDSRNLRSQAAIERLGGVKEGVLRKHMIQANGYIRDSVMYSILDTEWPAVKARLEEWLK